MHFVVACKFRRLDAQRLTSGLHFGKNPFKNIACARSGHTQRCAGKFVAVVATDALRTHNEAVGVEEITQLVFSESKGQRGKMQTGSGWQIAIQRIFPLWFLARPFR
jgi:hypothetical protein